MLRAELTARPYLQYTGRAWRLSSAMLPQPSRLPDSLVKHGGTNCSGRSCPFHGRTGLHIRTQASLLKLTADATKDCLEVRPPRSHPVSVRENPFLSRRAGSRSQQRKLRCTVQNLRARPRPPGRVNPTFAAMPDAFVKWCEDLHAP